MIDRQTVAGGEWVFFDRGLVDATSAMEATTAKAVLERLCLEHRYHRRVFTAPPWPELYANDAPRLHSFDDVVAEYSRLMLDDPHQSPQLCQAFLVE